MSEPELVGPPDLTPVTPVSSPIAADDAFALFSPAARIAGRELLRVDASGDFARDLLRDAVMISLFTDRRASDDQAPSRQRRGWHGDPTLGSRIWLVYRAGRLTDRAASDLRAYAVEALAWLTADGIATAVDVTVTRLPAGLATEVQVIRPDGTRLDYRWGPLWE